MPGPGRAPRSIGQVLWSDTRDAAEFFIGDAAAVIFTNGFESGDLLDWSDSTP